MTKVARKPLGDEKLCTRTSLSTLVSAIGVDVAFAVLHPNVVLQSTSRRDVSAKKGEVVKVCR